ncbi:MAG: hypothetical protein CM15mP55_2560 [Hyphomicrobiales bacterium]|nr:MAG: hypothetical protein CM15mP55_2560 [Hyphomicrobiales bacterium]
MPVLPLPMREQSRRRSGDIGGVSASACFAPVHCVGPEDDFSTALRAWRKLRRTAAFGGGLTRYQPVGVFDVAQAVDACLDGPVGIYELGGPQVYPSAN